MKDNTLTKAILCTTIISNFETKIVAPPLYKESLINLTLVQKFLVLLFLVSLLTIILILTNFHNARFNSKWGLVFVCKLKTKEKRNKNKRTSFNQWNLFSLPFFRHLISSPTIWIVETETVILVSLLAKQQRPSKPAVATSSSSSPRPGQNPSPEQVNTRSTKKKNYQSHNQIHKTRFHSPEKGFCLLLHLFFFFVSPFCLLTL